MKYTVAVCGRTFTVEVDGDTVRLDGRVVEAELLGADGACRRLRRDQVLTSMVAERGEERGTWRILAGGYRLEAEVLDDRARAIRASRRGASGHGGLLKAPMPGLVVRVLVSEGDTVEAGAGLVVVEAMKMENELKAAGPGTVRKVHAGPGTRVEKGAALVTLDQGRPADRLR